MARKYQPFQLEDTMTALCSSMVRHADEQCQTLDRLDTLLDFLPRPNSFYRDITNELFKRKIQNAICFENHTAIPNRLKYSTQVRRLSLHRLNLGHVLDIDSVIPVPQLAVYLHVTNGKGILHLRDRHDNSVVDYALLKNTSWMITRQQLTDYILIIRPLDMHLIVALEQLVPEPSHILQQIGQPSDQENEYSELLREGKSLIFKKESQTPVMFIASRYALGTDNNHHIVRMVITEYGKGLRFNEIICPRVSIRNMHTPETRMQVEDLENTLDAYWAHTLISNIIKDSIVVGMSPYEQLRKMKIDPNIIAGIRNLDRNKTCQIPATAKYHGQIVMKEGRRIFKGSEDLTVRKEKWHLDELIGGVLQDRRQYDLQDPFEEVYHVERVYNRLEKDWVDDIQLAVDRRIQEKPTKPTDNEIVEDEQRKKPTNPTDNEAIEDERIEQNTVDELQSEDGEIIDDEPMEEEPDCYIDAYYSAEEGWSETQQQIKQEATEKQERYLERNKRQENILLYSSGIDIDDQDPEPIVVHRYPIGKFKNINKQDIPNLTHHHGEEVRILHVPKEFINEETSITDNPFIKEEKRTREETQPRRAQQKKNSRRQ